jgi:hypothetical protein
MLKILDLPLPAARDLASDVAYASAAIARLDQALVGHPLQPALLYRARLDAGGSRPAIRAAIVRLWTRAKVTRLPLPLTGAAALKPQERWDEEPWIHVFLQALGEEAMDWLQVLADMERAWFRARALVSDRRSNSRAAMAVDMLVAAPIASASTWRCRTPQRCCRTSAAPRSQRGHPPFEAQALQPCHPCPC